MSVGEDAPNGLWASHGARLGCLMTNIPDSWDWKMSLTLDGLSEFFETEVFQSLQVRKRCVLTQVCVGIRQS